MNQSANTIDLAQLDAITPADVDASIWHNNLSALEGVNPDFAKQLAETEIPAHWQPTRGLDDVITYRIEKEGEPPCWLGHTAVPSIQIDAYVKSYYNQDLNITVPSVGTGAAILMLLERTPSHIGLFIFEQDVAAVAAVLRIVDLSAAITNWRCIFVPPDADIQFFGQLLDTHPGLLPPGNIFRHPGVPEEHVENLLTWCMKINQTTTASRSRAIGEAVKQYETKRDTKSDVPHFVFLAHTTDSRKHELANTLAKHADKLGWPNAAIAMATPLDVHLLKRTQAISDLAPATTLCIGHSIGGIIPTVAVDQSAEYYISSADVPEKMTDNGAAKFAASPTIRDRLIDAGIAENQVVDLWWGFDDLRQTPTAADFSNKILLIADLPNDSDKACDISQPTHKSLWKHAKHIIAQKWASREILHPMSILTAAERSANAQLGREELRKTFTQLIERVAIPVGVRLQIASALQTTFGPRLACVGNGWQRHDQFKDCHIANTLDESLQTLSGKPSATVFADLIDPFSQALMTSAGCGYPLVLFSPEAMPMSAKLGNLFHPDQHYLAFTNAKQLIESIESIDTATDTGRKRVDRTAELVKSDHSWRHRLQAIAGMQ